MSGGFIASNNTPTDFTPLGYRFQLLFLILRHQLLRAFFCAGEGEVPHLHPGQLAVFHYGIVSFSDKSFSFGLNGVRHLISIKRSENISYICFPHSPFRMTAFCCEKVSQSPSCQRLQEIRVRAAERFRLFTMSSSWSMSRA